MVNRAWRGDYYHKKEANKMPTLRKLFQAGHRRIGFKEWQSGAYLCFPGNDIRKFKLHAKDGRAIGRVQRNNYADYFDMKGWEERKPIKVNEN